jgi:citrate lyase subunit beta/citryl-CoA lyase
MTIKPRRSMLFMPASNARALEKGRTLPADGLIFDLEDSVAQDQKEAARRALVEALSSRAYGSRSLIVRVNGLDTPWGAEDVAALANCGADALLFPKVACAQDVLDATLAMDDADSPLNTRLWVMMETARGVLNAAEIADRLEQSPASSANPPPMRLNVLVSRLESVLLVKLPVSSTSAGKRLSTWAS